MFTFSITDNAVQIINPSGETFAEMSQETKNQVSHRARACAKMRELMKELHACEH